MINILKFSPFFKNVVIKRSFRQQPSLNSKLIMNVSTNKFSRPVKCNESACKICHLLYTKSEWTSKNGHTFKVGRVSCASSCVVYIIINKYSKCCLYIGQTCQRMNTRMIKHREEKTWFKEKSRKPSSIRIVAIEAPVAAVQRAEKEQLEGE